MTQNLNLDGLAAQIAVHKPSVVGAAFKVFLFGGSELGDTQAAQASGSAHLFHKHQPEIMKLVREMEGRVPAKVG